MLKYLTLILWVGPALLLFVYLLWISKGPSRLGESDGHQDAKSQDPMAETSQLAGDKQVGRRQRG